MNLIDTHTHIYLPEFDDDRDEMLKRAREAGVTIMLLPAIDRTTHGVMLEMEKFQGCHAMIGLHPCSVKTDYQEELSVIRELLATRSFKAIGETGLDFYWDKTFVKEQYDAFRQQAELALSYELPLVIHSREAIDECIAVVREFPALKGVFHCFSGNFEQAREILKTNFYLGIGGVVSFKNAGLDKVLESLDLDRIVLETDAPYLAPVPYRGKRNEPAYLGLIAEKIANVKEMAVQEVVKITSRNANNLFKLPAKP